MFLSDAEGRDELGRMGLLPDDGQPARDDLTAMDLMSDGAPEALAGDAFSLWPFRYPRVLRSGGKSVWRLPPSRPGRLPNYCRAIA